MGAKKKLAIKQLANAAEVSLAIGEIGVARRALIRIEADMNDDLGKAKADYERSATPLKEEIEAKVLAVRSYCEAHREEWGTKTAKFATGLVSWRARPPMVSVRSVKRALAWIIERGWREFLRVKHELNKEAMLAQPSRAIQIPGVKIASAGENFIVKPFESELEEVA